MGLRIQLHFNFPAKKVYSDRTMTAEPRVKVNLGLTFAFLAMILVIGSTLIPSSIGFYGGIILGFLALLVDHLNVEDNESRLKIGILLFITLAWGIGNLLLTFRDISARETTLKASAQNRNEP